MQIAAETPLAHDLSRLKLLPREACWHAPARKTVAMIIQLLDRLSAQPYRNLTFFLPADATMETTKLSSKGQVIIPKNLRNAHHWEAGLELVVIDTGEGILLKPKTPFVTTDIVNVAGMLKTKTMPKTDMEIEAALKSAARRQWRDRN